MILVDSSVWIDYLRGSITPQAAYLDRLLESELLATGDLILLEVLQGVKSEQQFDEVRRLLGTFNVVTLGGEAIALQAARNFRALRGLGISVRKTIDTVIATWCIENECPLLYSDRDFDPFVIHLGLRSAAK